MGLGTELGAIRTEARLSQGELARLAGISRNSVGSIEREEWKPKAPTLRQLADGAATDGAGSRDEQKADSYYERLMRAAGYLEDRPVVPSEERRRPVEDLTDDEVRALLTRYSQDQTVSAAFLGIAQEWTDLDPSAQRFLLWSIEETRRIDAQAKAAAQSSAAPRRSIRS